VADRAECDKLAQYLRDAGIKAEAYHAGLSDTQRNNVQLRWIREDDCKVSLPCRLLSLSSLTLQCCTQMKTLSYLCWLLVRCEHWTPLLRCTYCTNSLFYDWRSVSFRPLIACELGILRHSLTFCMLHQLNVPRYYCSRFGRRAFSIAGPRAWNPLPDHICNPSLSSGFFQISTEDIPLHNACTGTRSAVEAFFCIMHYTSWQSLSSSSSWCKM